jgi:hypothetical protein
MLYNNDEVFQLARQGSTLGCLVVLLRVMEGSKPAEGTP